MLAIADERNHLLLQETDLETKMIQNYILELIMMMEAVRFALLQVTICIETLEYG